MVDSKIISGTANIPLATTVANSLNKTLVNTDTKKFANGEILFKIKDNIRNCDIYFINTTFNNTSNGYTLNDYLMETIIGCNSCKDSSSKSICLIIPFFPYARSDKKMGDRVAISARIVCDLFKSSGINSIVSMDLHSGQIQGFAGIPFENLYAKPLFVKYLRNKFTPEQLLNDCILVAPDYGAVKRICSYAKTLKMRYAGLNKQRDYTTENSVLESELNCNPQKIIDKTCIIIDDMIDTAGTMVAAVNELGKYGAKDVIVIATHGILSGPAIERINGCNFMKSIVVTNTLPQEDNLEKCHKLVVVDISEMLTNVIRCFDNGSSIRELNQI